MRTIIAVCSVGITFALGSAALARPVDRLANPADPAVLLECRSSAGAKAKTRNYYRHKRLYRRDQEQPHDPRTGASRPPQRRDQEGAGSPRPGVRQPAVRARPLLAISA
jgi:hypothetical protein